MRIHLPEAVSIAIQKLNIAGYEAYTVGGCVRDSLMGRTPDDWDVTTSATPQEMQCVFADYRTIETGLQHGTLTVLIEDTSIEITTYRVDGVYTDGRHPDEVIFSRLLSEDLRRRDFTINAMAYHPQHGLVDLYDGQKDLQAGIIRCVGNPRTRFSEDALRILRAIRFSSVLGYRVDGATDAALRALSPTLPCVSVERITAELNKLLCGVDAQRVVSDYAFVLSRMVPAIHSARDFSLLSKVPPTLAVRWAALLWSCNIPHQGAEALLRGLRLDNRTIREIVALLSCRNLPNVEDKDVLWLLNRLDSVLIYDYLWLCNADNLLRLRIERLLATNRCYKTSMLAVNGNDLAGVGVAEGPEMGRMLQALLTAVIDGKCANTKADLIKYTDKIKKPVP